MYVKLALSNVAKSIKDFAVYFFTLMVGVAVFYAFNSVGDQDMVLLMSEQQTKMMDLLNMLMDIVSVLIVAVLAFLVIYASRFLARRRNREFAMYQLLGMTRGQIVCVTAAETVAVGVLSLACGLGLGIAISQGLLLVTASMFEAQIPGFELFVSTPAIVRTLIVFAAIFSITVFATARRAAMTPLIELMADGRRNEVFRLRSLPLSFALFIVACAIIGVSYKLLLDTGLLAASPEFLAATVLVCIGTALFFYSLSGFLLKLVQLIKPVYYRGLNMFTARQIAARANSSFASMSVICMTLFFALTSVSGGIGICLAMQDSLDKSTAYDASVTLYWEDAGDFMPFALEHDRDMAQGLAASTDAVDAPAFDTMVADSAQLDYRTGNLTFGDLDNLAAKPLSEYTGSSAVSPGYQETPLSVVALSQVNAALELAGEEPLTLEDGHAILLGNTDVTLPYLREVCAQSPQVTVYDRPLALEPELAVMYLETSGFAGQVGAIVVNDEDIPADAGWYYSILNVMYPEGIGQPETAEEQFASFTEDVRASSDMQTMPISLAQTRTQVIDQSVGMTTIVSYLAIYIGLILVVACAAILAIQQLTGASDNAHRYRLLSKLGASGRMVAGSLLKQIGVAFVFPLLLAIAHTMCAMKVVIDVVKVFGSIDIGAISLIAGAGFLAIYGIYFLITFLTARSMVK